MIRYLPLIFLLGCNAMPNEVIAPEHPFGDATRQKLYNFQDQRQTDSLLAYFGNEAHQAQAALAFASMQDTAALPKLFALLSSPLTQTRLAAAYAIGQYRMASHAPALQQALLAEKDLQVQEAMLEAIGKSSSPENVGFLTNFDFQEQQAYSVALGLYRSAANGHASEKGLLRASALLADVYEDSVRIMASAYASRSPKLDISAVDSLLQYVMRHDSNAFVRMNCAKAFRKEKYTKAIAALIYTAKRDENHLVRLEAVKSLRVIGGKEALAAGFDALADAHAHVGVEAATLIAQLASKTDTARISEAMTNAKHWRVRTTLAGATMKHKANGTSDILAMIAQANVYEQGELLLALAQRPINYEFIKERLLGQKNVVVRSYAAQAMYELVRTPEAKIFVKKRPTAQGEWRDIIVQSMQDADVATVYHGALALRDEQLSLYKTLGSTEPLKAIQAKLQMPKDIEAYQELQALIDVMEKKKTPTAIEKSVAHPINWAWVMQIPVGAQIEVKTNKGTFVMKLLVADAPGTVAEIASLVKSGFYHGKNFHRVVPNFVAQGGCPRGDGFGGLPYTIRSEFAPLKYGEGYVGMASAGKDTESCQWFITHSPTPHLDGRYTIFAKIVSGMQVVHQLEIGDVIEDTRLVL